MVSRLVDMFSTTFFVALGAFTAVAGAVGFIAVKIRGGEGGRSEGRLDKLVGRGGRRDSSADMLLKQAMQEADKVTLLDAITPAILNYTKYFEQADTRIKPSTLFGAS